MTDQDQKKPRHDDQNSAVRAIIRHTRKTIIAVIGGTVVLIGIALLVLPGPGLAIIALGVAILAIEFAWAKRAMEKGKVAVDSVKRRFGSTNRKSEKPPDTGKNKSEETA